MNDLLVFACQIIHGTTSGGATVRRSRAQPDRKSFELAPGALKDFLLNFFSRMI